MGHNSQLAALSVVGGAHVGALDGRAGLKRGVGDGLCDVVAASNCRLCFLHTINGLAEGLGGQKAVFVTASNWRLLLHGGTLVDVHVITASVGLLVGFVIGFDGLLLLHMGLRSLVGHVGVVLGLMGDLDGDDVLLLLFFFFINLLPAGVLEQIFEADVIVDGRGSVLDD